MNKGSENFSNLRQNDLGFAARTPLYQYRSEFATRAFVRLEANIELR